MRSAAASRPRRRTPRPCLVESRPVNNELTKRLMWSGLLAAVGALTTIVANRVAGLIWERVFHEEPPGFD